MTFRKSLIFSRNIDNTALSKERIEQLAPAVFSASKAEHLTDRYVSLHTSDLIPVMRDYGYVPVQAAQRASRKPKNSQVISGISQKSSEGSGYAVESFNAHLLSFACTSTLNQDLRPEIILYNSHDGSSSVQLYAGCYRFICSNGIVAGEGFNQRMLHSKSGLQGFEEMLKNTVESLPEVQARIQRLKQVQLDAEQQYLLATKGVSTRWDLLPVSQEYKEFTGTFADSRTVQNALRSIRYEDMQNDAFTVFNRIQEAVIRGNAYVQSFTKVNPYGAPRKARAVGSAKESIRINTELWNAAEEVAFG
ncbi:hypothetical protein P26059A_0111 [Curvibacter phage P26059A]|nr:hypothetical protein P26059A_0111 [Curvibacter phage P26059A]